MSSLLSLGEVHEEPTSGNPESLRQALRRDAASPYRWCDLGEGLLQGGKKDEARYCFEQALQLGPNVPPVLMRAAFFHFQTDETAAALERSARVLQLVPSYDDVIFQYYDKAVTTVAEVLPYLSGNRRASQAYFRHILASGRTDDAKVVWEWLGTQGFRENRLTAEYLELLHRQ